jgi:DNA helicase-2/ATP-dependent DNA helicase PcrA
VDTLQQYAFSTESSVYDALLDIDEIGFTAGTREKLVGFRDLIKTWIIDSQEMPVNELAKKVVADTRMREAYADESDESINKRANIEEFINSVDDYCKLNPEATLTDYLNQVTLSSDTDDMDDGNYVTLATIHSVKGLEYDIVHVIGVDGKSFDTMKNEDEMACFYVACTRAKEQLYLWYEHEDDGYMDLEDEGSSVDDFYTVKKFY